MKRFIIILLIFFNKLSFAGEIDGKAVVCKSGYEQDEIVVYLFADSNVIKHSFVGKDDGLKI